MAKRALRLLPLLILSSWLAACGDNAGNQPDAQLCTPVDDNNACTNDVCEGNQAVHNPVAAGTTCPTGACNATGMCIAPTCTDGVKNGTETDIDCGGTCAPASVCADAEGCAIAADCASGVCTAMICAAASCGDGVMQAGEMCDDGNHTNGDGCDDGAGGSCRATGCGNGTVSGTEVCDDGNAVNGDGCDNNCTTTACGNGITTGAETCDDGNTVINDGCSATCAVESGYTCTMVVPSVCSTTCGDGIVAGTEACDDAPPAEAGDGCSATCTIETGFNCAGSPSVCTPVCGNGILQAGEQCDDGNMLAGDGCSTTCQIDITCGAGEVPVIVSNTTPFAIPDNMPGISSPVTVTSVGAITKMVMVVGDLPHTDPNDIDMFLVAPNGLQREISTDNSGGADNFRGTQFDDTATTSITAGTAPFTGRFKPEQSLATTAGTDFRGVNGAGIWTLKVTDDAAGDVGTLNSWTLTMCVNPTLPYCGDSTTNGADQCDDGNTNNDDACTNQCKFSCGDGIVGANEQCDDGNTVAGDGCGSTCQFDLGCAVGETSVIVTNATAFPIPDNSPTGVESPVTVASSGAVTKAGVYIASLPHTFDGDINLFLVGPNTRQRELSTGNGSTGDNYTRSFFDDGATVLVTAGAAPFTGRFKPEQSLTTTASADFQGQSAAGAWKLKAVDVANSDTGTLNSWTLMLCINPTAPYCGDSTTNGTDECDDGNANNADACDNNCQITDGCGDGNIDAGEACDDNNIAGGDGCSATCQLEITCGAGELPVIVSNNGTFAIPDNTPAGISSPVSVAIAGAVTKVSVLVGDVTHPADADVDMFLVAPNGVQRELSTDQSGVNYRQTSFDDSATIAITAGTAPYNGRFRPEQTLTSALGTDFSSLNAVGTWNLKVADDSANTSTGTLNGWTLSMCVNPTATFCGDSTVNGAEQCDDGNTNNNDACSNLCKLNCGDGNIEPGETCDDGNTVSGDGCSATCQVDITCGAGESAVIVSNNTTFAIPDNTPAGILSPVTVGTAGAVTKMSVIVGDVTHAFDVDMDIFLVSPSGVQRELSTDQSGVNYRGTALDDGAATAVTAGTAPYTGRFRPEQTLASTAGTDFLGVNGAGAWNLKVVDDASGGVGTLNSWTLAMCVNSTVPFCGDGTLNGTEQCDDGNTNDSDACSNGCKFSCGDRNIDTGEECDDGNTVAGDGCSATCQIDITCGAGETPVIVSNNTTFPIPDNNAAGILSPVSVGTAGAVTKLSVVVGDVTHAVDADMDIFLVGPSGVQRELSTDQSGVNYRGTALDDGAATAVTTGTAPYTGRFKPEQTLSTTTGTDFRGVNAAGVWNLKVADDSAGTTGTLNKWTLTMCVNTTATYCGDGTVNGTEQCDDANTNDFDACSNGCKFSCGDGNIDNGEACDDGNTVSGDGCSATCQVDITCGAGESAVIVSNNTTIAIPDNTPAGILSPVTVATAGEITKLRVLVGDVTHTVDADVDMFLVAPNGVERELSTDQSGVNYRGTSFDESATPSITSGTAPYTGKFKPEQTLASTAGTDFRSLNGAGTWNLKVADDTANTTTGTLNGWTLSMCVNPTTPYCGDSITNGTEQCDDGNTNANDVCNNLCRLTCGDGIIGVGEECDDRNQVAGDGCSATCTHDIACGAGETAVIVTNSTASAIPDTKDGVVSFADVGTAGLVRRVIVTANITYPTDSHINLFLRSPWGVRRDLSSGQSGANYTQTIFSDTAATSITAGTAPYTGAFKPEQTISNAAGFGNQTAFGAWSLDVSKNSTGAVGTLNSWTIAACVDTSATSVCGNGVVEANETCDDNNTTAGDGCSATCQVELTCATGSPVIVRGAGLPLVIPDFNTTGVSTIANVATTGTVTKAIVVLGTITHTWDADMNISLISPMGTSIDLSSGNGSSNDDMVSTILDDAATTSITSAPAGARGRFKPEAALAGVNTQPAMGDWTLKIVDTANGDGGIIVSWTVGLCVQ